MGHHDICGLNIVMGDTSFMEIPYCAGELTEVRSGLSRWETDLNQVGEVGHDNAGFISLNIIMIKIGCLVVMMLSRICVNGRRGRHRLTRRNLESDKKLRTG